jgi:hypothetical protein
MKIQQNVATQGTLTTTDTKTYWCQGQWENLGYPTSWKNKRVYCILKENYEELRKELPSRTQMMPP